jgi:hypothetical protein
VWDQKYFLFPILQNMTQFGPFFTNVIGCVASLIQSHAEKALWKFSALLAILDLEHLTINR